MASANEYLRDEAIRHALHADKFGKGLATKIVKLLNSADDDLVSLIAGRLATIRDRGFDPGPATTKRLQELLESIQNINSTVYEKVRDGLAVELGDLSEYEAEYAASSVQSAIGFDVPMSVPGATYLRTLVETSPIDGFLLKSWTDHMSAQRKGRVEQAIRIGLVEGQTIDKIVQRIRGTKAQGYADGILNISRKSAQTLALTASATVANNARQAVYKRNPRIIKQLKWISTLDTRTSSICQSRDGELYDLDATHPTPPAHPRCRSVLIPITKRWDEMGISRKDVPEGKRASVDGQVPGNTKFGDWIANQSPERQDQVFGKERAQLFRDGKVGFKDLFDTNGQYKNLDELRRGERPTTPAIEIIDPKEIDAREKKYVVDRGRDTQTEHLVAYDRRTGAIVERKQGNRNSVAFSHKLVAALDDPASEIILHHNHPSSSSLSMPDMQVVSERPGARGIWAHAHNGSSFYAEKGKRKLSKKTVNAVSGALHTNLQKLINLQAVTIDDAMLLHNHLTWLVVHDLEQIVYRADLAGDSLEAWERNKTIFKQILENLK